MSAKRPYLLEYPAVTTGLDTVIKDLYQRLDSLSWLTGRAYGRAWLDYNDGQRVPVVYIGNKEYIDALPNDYFPAMSFFFVKSDEKTSFDSDTKRGKPIVLQRDLSLIVWVNLEKLDTSEAIYDYIYTEFLKNEVYEKLKASQYVASINSYTDDDIRKVYADFDFIKESSDYLERTENQLGAKRDLVKKAVIESKYMKYPYAAFKVDFTVKYFQKQC